MLLNGSLDRSCNYCLFTLHIITAIDHWLWGVFASGVAYILKIIQDILKRSFGVSPPVLILVDETNLFAESGGLLVEWTIVRFAAVTRTAVEIAAARSPAKTRRPASKSAADYAAFWSRLYFNPIWFSIIFFRKIFE